MNIYSPIDPGSPIVIEFSSFQQFTRQFNIARTGEYYSINHKTISSEIKSIANNKKWNKGWQHGERPILNIKSLVTDSIHKKKI